MILSATYHRVLIKNSFRSILRLWAALLTASGLHSQSTDGIQIRFLDSATGYAVQPESLKAISPTIAGTTSRAEQLAVTASGQALVKVAAQHATLKVEAAKYLPSSVDLVPAVASNYRINLFLDPVQTPWEISPEYIATLWKANHTLFVGYVVDEESGRPIPGARVRTEPSGVESMTDARGYFQIHVPVQTLEAAHASPASLSFRAEGYVTEERRFLELWSNGDWVYRIWLKPGEGTKVVDEREFRRRSDYPVGSLDDSPGVTGPAEPSVVPRSLAQEGANSPVQLASTTANVRIPSNIRVLRSDGVTIDYLSLQTYCQRSLPSEWIASWGSTGPGNSGTNCLLAGAVAVRTYAAGYVNTPASTSYDICGTTSCQAYSPTASDSRTTAAVNATANYVMFRPGDVRLGFKVTEYSAENNSLGYSCGDGYTQPTGGCVYDPVCSGESRFGHGRGMCQWGTARWASGRRMANRSTGDSVTNGFAIQNWVWLCEHYYPTLVLALGSPLNLGDDVKVVGVATLVVRLCPDGTITNGINCAQIVSKASGSVGTIVDGPLRVTVDGAGYTWWRVDWGDTNGWCVENYLERISAAPNPPSGLVAAAVSPFQINLSWSDNSGNEIGTLVERALTATGPWTTNAVLRAGVSAWTDTNVAPATTYYYRARQFNQTTISTYSSVTNASTPGLAPMLAPIPDQTVIEGQLLTFTNTAVAAQEESSLTDFENYAASTAVMFRLPNFSGSTSAFLSNSPNGCAVTASFPTGNSSGRALNVSWAFSNSVPNPWLRLTTSSAANLPNPVVDFTRWLRIRLWSDQPLGVAIGLRETTVVAGTTIGANGGTTGGIEWAGVTNVIGGQPQPLRQVSANQWTTLEFNLPAEPIWNFSGGNGILATASGLGVLEHLALVPLSSNNTHNIYLDDFVVYSRRDLFYSLDSGAPANASINPLSGVFSWIPSEEQGPGYYDLRVRVTDSAIPPQSDAKSFHVTVSETNAAPILTPVADRVVHAGAYIFFTNSASDSDLPPNTLSFSLDSSTPEGASVDSSGLFAWQTTFADAGTTNNLTIRVTDSGSPARSDVKAFRVIVVAPPSVALTEVRDGNFVLTWSAIPGMKYRVQFKNSLDGTTWQDLMPVITASALTASKSDSLSPVQRFYRVMVDEP